MNRSVLNSTTSRQRISTDATANPLGCSRFNPEADAVGRVLSGRFRIERLIGRGSMGVVFVARHVELDTRVAIKTILPEMQLVAGVVSRFAREAKAAVAIRSEHVAQVFDVGTDEELGPFIVMEFLEGRDLRAALELDGRVPLRRAVDYVLQACEALAAAHSRGVIHRDIKPENLFLTRQGNLEVVKLLDFGISKAALTGQLFGGELAADDGSCLMGTPLYMSPEQIRSLEHVDARADIWSLGAVLYELVTGQSAFSATVGLQTLLQSILEGAPAPLAEYCGEADCALQGVIDQCLQKNPARRFQSVAELAAALLPFASSRARLHAQRAASILGTQDASESSAIASPAPLSRSELPATELPASEQPPPASGWRERSSSESRVLPSQRVPARGPQRHRGPLVAVALGVSLVLLLAAGLRGVHPLTRAGVHAEPVVVSAESPRSVEPTPDSSPRDSVPEPPVSRTVLIESQPSGALVKIEGQAIGVTPLSTLLPPGTVRLAVEKDGYLEAESVVELEPGGKGAKPLLTRVVLQQAPSEPAPEPELRHAHKPAAPSGVRSVARARPEPGRPRVRLVQD
jgi:serine/threonine protein kinase